MEKRTLQKLGLLCASVALCSIAAWWSGNEEGSRQVQKLTEQPVLEQAQEIRVTVCVSGAVAKPGLYQLPKGSRAQQAIELAGGVTGEADLDRVNLAQACKDGGHIKVPRLSRTRLKQKMEKQKGTEFSSNTVPRKEEKTGNAGAISVHLNSATEAELERLPGIGKATARQIIAFRNRRAFQRIEEVMQVPGIGPAKFKKMRRSLAL